MSDETITCPYCNSSVPPPAAPAGPRLSCPRCGESFPYRPSENVQAAPTPDPAASPAVSLAAAPPRTTRWSNRRLGLTVMGGMICMALAGLTFALMTVKNRRDHDPKPPPLPVVAYLPPGTNLVLGLRVAELGRSPAGKRFLEQSEIARAGLSFEDIERATGLKRDELDEVLIGVKTDELRIVLVARTKRPYDADQLRATLKAGTGSDAGQKKAYHFEVPKLGWSCLLWSPDDRTLVIASSSQAMKTVPDHPAPTADPLAGRLRDLLQERLRPGPQVWLVGTVENWEAARLLLSARVPKDDLDALTSVRALGVGLHFDDDVRLDAAFQSTNDEAAAALETTLTKAKGTRYLRLQGGGPEGDRVAKELAASLKSERQGPWVLLRASTGGEGKAKSTER